MNNHRDQQNQSNNKPQYQPAVLAAPPETPAVIDPATPIKPAAQTQPASDQVQDAAAPCVAVPACAPAEQAKPAVVEPAKS